LFWGGCAHWYLAVRSPGRGSASPWPPLRSPFRQALAPVAEGPLLLGAALELGEAIFGRGRRAQVRRQRGDGRVAEHVDQGELAVLLLELAMNFHQQQRVAAQVEEVVVDADAGHAEGGLPGRGDAALDLAARRQEALAGRALGGRRQQGRV